MRNRTADETLFMAEGDIASLDGEAVVSAPAEEPAPPSRLREFWLPGAPLDVRRSTDGKSMRITWTLGNSSVDVNFYEKGPAKSMVQVQHTKLSDAEAVAAQKAYWSEGLERLRAWLEGPR